jgi:hypothetical protein
MTLRNILFKASVLATTLTLSSTFMFFGSFAMKAKGN